MAPKTKLFAETDFPQDATSLDTGPDTFSPELAAQQEVDALAAGNARLWVEQDVVVAVADDLRLLVEIFDKAGRMLQRERDALRASEAAAVECSEALQAKLARTEIERDYDRRQTAHLQTVVDRLNAQLAAMTDSRDAAVARVGVANWSGRKGNTLHCGARLSPPSPPTADKEPKT